MQKVIGLEKQIADAMSKIQVRKLQSSVLAKRAVTWFCSVIRFLTPPAHEGSVFTSIRFSADYQGYL